MQDLTGHVKNIGHDRSLNSLQSQHLMVLSENVFHLEPRGVQLKPLKNIVQA